MSAIIWINSPRLQFARGRSPLFIRSPSLAVAHHHSLVVARPCSLPVALGLLTLLARGHRRRSPAVDSGRSPSSAVGRSLSRAIVGLLSLISIISRLFASFATLNRRYSPSLAVARHRSFAAARHRLPTVSR